MTLRIDICNKALSRIGLEPIQSEGADGADSIVNIYDGVTDNLISLYGWHFCDELLRLPRLSLPADEQRQEIQFKYAFKLPPNRVGPPTSVYDSKKCDKPLKCFALRGADLWADSAEIWIDYVRLPDPLNWPGYFTELVLTAMMSEIALSVREDKSLSQMHYQKAFGTPRDGGMGGLFATARSREASSKPSRSFGQSGGMLLRARRS